jgi:hypothetical protein
MTAKNSKSRSTRTIFRKRDGTYVVVRDEGGVIRIYWFCVVKSNLRAISVGPDRAAVVLGAAIADEAAIIGMAADAVEPIAIAEHALPMQLRALKDALER